MNAMLLKVTTKTDRWDVPVRDTREAVKVLRALNRLGETCIAWEYVPDEKEAQSA